MRDLKIGLFGIGLDAYWPQFVGLKEQIESYVQIVELRLKRPGVEIVNLGLIDSPPKAHNAGHQFRTADVDLIFLHVTTYALSSTVLPVVQRAKVPVIILNLQPTKAIDYATFNKIADRTKQTGLWLSHVNACPVPEISNVFKRARVRFHEVTGVLTDDPATWREVDEWLDAARVAHVLGNHRLGLMGHLYCGMLDISCDTTQVSITFGTHVELIEVDELARLRDAICDKAQIDERIEKFRKLLHVVPECSYDDLAASARTSLALDRLVEHHDLGALAFYYSGAGSNAEAISSIILGNTLLTARGVPVAGEYDVRTAQAMKIFDALGVGGTFTEYTAIDFNDDVVLMGHDGACHINIAETKATVRPIDVFHGKAGSGLTIDMQVRHGPATLLAITTCVDGSLRFVYAEAQSEAGAVLDIGNTVTRYRFSIGARRFVNEWNRHGPGHHCAIGIGRLGSKIEKLAQLIGIETTRVC